MKGREEWSSGCLRTNEVSNLKSRKASKSRKMDLAGCGGAQRQSQHLGDGGRRNLSLRTVWPT
jgi:hypothetical protein